MTSASAPKYRVACEACGEKSPRPVTSWTIRNWMIKHDQKHAADRAV